MIRSPIKWVGGKYKLRKRVVQMLPKHECYVEVFGGAAWVLFAKDTSPVEVLNDIDEELINFFRVLREQPNELMASFKWELVSRSEFNRLLKLDPVKLSPVDRAHRFYYLIMSSWGGELGSVRFQTSVIDGGHGNRLFGALEHLEERVRPAYERLQNVILENLSWADCLERYDNLKTVFYLDPPYPGNKVNYRHNMRGVDEHKLLVEKLRGLEGKWLLSTYDTPQTRALYEGFQFCPVTFPSGMAGNGFRNTEVLVTNYQMRQLEVNARP